jgi:probable HAF family extracellular repeat protein
VLAVTDGKIVFVSTRGFMGTEIWTMNADGTGLQELTQPPYTNTNPVWSPDGTKIAFRSERDGVGQVYVMNADGTGQTRLTTSGAVDEQPSWSPDGSKIAFTSWRDGHAQIYVMNADGTNQTRLTNNPAIDYQPNWSPDGTHILFTSYRSAKPDIWVMNADGSNQYDLITNNQMDLFPNFTSKFSPDGTKIVFGRDLGNDLEIFTVLANGSGPMTNISKILGPSNVEPNWSPDGSMLVWGHEGTVNGNHIGDIYIAPADGSGVPTNLTHSQGEANFQSSWQPLGVPQQSAALPEPPPHALAPPQFGAPTILSISGALPAVPVKTVVGDDVTFTVALSQTTVVPVIVGFTTINSGLGFALGQQAAFSGRDYTVTNGVLTFQPGETSKTITVHTLTNGGSAFTPDEIFSVLLLSPSGAIFTNPFGNAAITTPNRASELFVKQIYRDLLFREVDAGGLQFWSSQIDDIDQGQARSNVVLRIEQSLEYRNLETQALYWGLLRRPADPGALNASVAFLEAGGPVKQLQAMVLGSAEYFQRRGGGTNAGFLAALYRDTLGRAIDPGGAAFFGHAMANSTSRTAVALAVMGSQESDAAEAQALYRQFLRRAADPGGSGFFTNVLQRGTTNEGAAAGILASGEFLADALSATQLNLVDLGSLGGTGTLEHGQGLGINSSGQITGESFVAGDTAFHAFLATAGRMTDLGTLGGSISSGQGISLSSSGQIQVSGVSDVVTGSPSTHAFLFSGGSLRDLGTLGGSTSFGAAINNGGQVVGNANLPGDTASHAFLYNGGPLRDLGTLGGTNSSALGINTAGQVVGKADLAGSMATHAFLFSGGLLQDLGTLGGTNSSAQGINDASQVVGTSEVSPGNPISHAFLWNSVHGMQDLGTLGGPISIGFGINNAGDVVGVSFVGTMGDHHGFLFRGGVMTDLNNLIPAGFGVTILEARGINDRGQIAAIGRTATGATHDFLLTPTS